MATSSKTSKRKRRPAKTAAEGTAAHVATQVAPIAMELPEPVVAEAPARTQAAARTETVSEPVAPSNPAGPVVVLASNCGVRDAAELKQTLCTHENESAPVALDVRSVERIDTATVQVLCAFVRDRTARQQMVEWLGDSQALKDAARLLGVAGMLALGARESHNNSGAAA